MAAQQYCLKWNNYYSNMTTVFDTLLKDETFVDVTLVCGEIQIKAHKVVLSACSQFFQSILADNPCQHPIIILPKDINFRDLKHIVDFIYRGQIDVSHDHLPELLLAAEQLKIKGLYEVPDKSSNNGLSQSCNSPQSPVTKSRSIQTFRFKRKTSFSGQDSSQDVSAEDNFDSDIINNQQEKKLKLCEEGNEEEDSSSDKSSDCGINSDPSPENCSEVNNREETLYDYKSEQNESTSGMEVKLEPQMYNEEKKREDDVTITPELFVSTKTDGNTNQGDEGPSKPYSKTWNREDMGLALEALKMRTMNLSRASATFGIPPTTLWQRAHRLGIDTPKKEGPFKTWNEENLNAALEALRNGTISANRASKEYGIPSSTLYKIAKREGIRLAQPFNSTPPSWSKDDLKNAFEAIKNGMSVTRASMEFGIPSGTLYGKVRREGIELRSKEQLHWCETDLQDAIEALRIGDLSINQAAINFNVPYSTLYNRYKKITQTENSDTGDGSQDIGNQTSFVE